MPRPQNKVDMAQVKERRAQHKAMRSLLPKERTGSNTQTSVR